MIERVGREQRLQVQSLQQSGLRASLGGRDKSENFSVQVSALSDIRLVLILNQPATAMILSELLKGVIVVVDRCVIIPGDNKLITGNMRVTCVIN